MDYRTTNLVVDPLHALWERFTSLRCARERGLQSRHVPSLPASPVRPFRSPSLLSGLSYIVIWDLF